MKEKNTTELKKGVLPLSPQEPWGSIPSARHVSVPPPLTAKEHRQQQPLPGRAMG